MEYPDFNDIPRIVIYKDILNDVITYYVVFTGPLSRLKEFDDRITVYIYSLISQIKKDTYIKTRDKYRWID